MRILRHRWWVMLIGVLGCVAAEQPSAPPQVVFVIDAAGAGQIEVHGLDPALVRQFARRADAGGWAARFPVYTGSVLPAAATDQPMLLGDWRVVDGIVGFDPRFPLVPEQPYVAAWKNGDTVLAEASFAFPAPFAGPPARVVAVYPSTDRLPQNQLRFYVQFSASMSRGEAARQIKLFDATGTEVTNPFVVPQQELWNPATDRLTLVFDPGRIKRGVGPHEELGPTLQAGQSYRLVIAAGWLDGRSQALTEPFEKVFQVVVADRQSPRPQDWRLLAPAGSAAELVLNFAEPLDHALLSRMVWVENAAGQRLVGEVQIEPGESGWRFLPSSPWSAGDYAVRIDPALEDLAGNSPRRLFDAPSKGSLGAPGEPLALAFRVSLGG